MKETHTKEEREKRGELWGELHLHTPYSDGRISFDDILNSGLDFVAITDHDTVAGFVAAKKALGNNPGIKLIPGIEFSVWYGKKGLHILAYFPDYKNPEFLEEMEFYRKKSVERAKKNFSLLRQLGFAVDESRINNNGTVAKPDIARNVFSFPQNLELLEKNRIHTTDDFIEAYLNSGKPAYARLEKISLEKVREYCKGPLVLAHPGKDLVMGREDWIVRELKEKYGLKGIETYTRQHTPKEASYYSNLAKELGLVAVSSSDAHHPESIGLYTSSYKVIEDLLK